MPNVRRKVLSMLAEGKITVQESEELLATGSRKTILTLLAAGRISVEDSEMLLAAADSGKTTETPTSERSDEPCDGSKRNWGEELGSMAKNIGDSLRGALKQVEPPSREFKDRLKEFGGWMQNVVGSLTDEFSSIRGEPLDAMHVDFDAPTPDGFERCKRCVIENLFGDVVISEGSEFSMHVTGRMSKAALEGEPPNLWYAGHAMRVEGDTLFIGLDNKSPAKAVLELAISLPPGMIISGHSVSSAFKINGHFTARNFQTVSGDILLTGVDVNSGELETVSGDIRIEGGKLDVQTKTTSGNLTIRSCRLKTLVGQSVSGDISLAEATITADTLIRGNTTSGDVMFEDIAGPWGQVEVTTRTGDMQVHWSGSSSSTSRNGQLLKSGQPGASIEIETVSGDITFN